MVWNPSRVESFSSQKTTLIDFLHVAKQNKSQLQCVSTSSGMLWLAPLTAHTQNTMVITTTSLSISTPEVSVGRPRTALVFERLHPFILSSKTCSIAFCYLTWWHTLNRQYSSQALSHTLYTLHLDKGASRLLLSQNYTIIWFGQENTPNAWVHLFTALAPWASQPPFSHSLTASTLLATHSREQDGASHDPPGPCPARMIFLKNILIDTAIKQDVSKQSSYGTSVRGGSNPLPRASLSWECRAFIRAARPVSQPERVQRKENIWE